MKNQKLNILLICKSLPWRFKGGIQTHTWDLARTLVEKGHSVSILSGGAFKKPLQKYLREGVEVIEIPFFPGRYIKPISLFAEEFSFNFEVRKWVNHNHNEFDIIHAQGRSGYLLYTNKSLHHKLVITIHGVTSIEAAGNKSFHFNSKIHSSITWRLEQKMLRASRLSIAVSQDLKNTLGLKGISKNIEVIPNGVKNLSPVGNQKLQKTEDKFLFIGRLHPIKGLLPLLKAMNESNDDLLLDIVGDGPERKELQAFIDSHHLGNRIQLMGEKTEKQIQSLLPSYRALVLPSTYETQGIVLLEANALAVPVIASDLVAIRESVSHGYNGLLCDLNQSSSFIDAMNYMLSHKDTAKIMGLNGQFRVKKDFSWDSITENTIASYQKIAS
ncbi:MAG: glycosyltransferase involved in cell wall biosynthesis [Roseivirga sp.]|jgi:glycosyltransferase involved in cell wall biosynthesis